MKNLERYLSKCYDQGIIYHSIQVSRDSFGTIAFSIHSDNNRKDTLDFVVYGNNLKQLFIEGK